MYFTAFVKLPLRQEFPFAQTLRIMKLLTFFLVAFCLQVSKTVSRRSPSRVRTCRWKRPSR